MWMTSWVAAVYFVVAAFLRFCVLVTQCQPHWYRERTPLSTRGWMWSCVLLDSTLRSTSRIRIDRGCIIGFRSKSRLFLPWTGVLKGGLGLNRGVVLGHLARTKMLGLPDQFGVARLLEDVVVLVYMGYPLSVIRGLVHSLPCSRVAQICRKTVRTWLSFHKKGMACGDMQKPQHHRGGNRRDRSGGDRDSGWRRRRVSARKSSSSSSSSAVEGAGQEEGEGSGVGRNKRRSWPRS